MQITSPAPISCMIPENLHKFLPEKETPWQISSKLFERIMAEPYEAGKGRYKKCPLFQGDPESDFVFTYFEQHKPVNRVISNVYCIHNPTLTSEFVARVANIDAEAQIFMPEWRAENDAATREKVIQRWQTQANQFSPITIKKPTKEDTFTHVRVLPLVHGTSQAVCHSIASTGFTYFGKHHFLHPEAKAGKFKNTDPGYFGGGIYFTNSAKYAAMYDTGTLIIAWVAMREPFPVINDVPHPNQGSDMQKLRALGAYQAYDAHYIPVSPTSNNPNCMEYYPCYQNQVPVCDEFVVFQKAQALPRFLIELGIGLPKQLPSYLSEAQVRILEKKRHLEELRKKDSQNYPSYLDELLDQGYFHLYDHLLSMKSLGSRNDRLAEVKKISFSLLSYIVLEVRDVVVGKVEQSIPPDSHNILFLLGGSGAGKSTTLCFLRGDQMVLKNFHYELQNEQTKIIGHEGAISCTFLPTTELVKDLVIVDFPGFDDSHGPIVSLGMECALKALIKKYHPKVVVLESITNTEDKYAAAARLGSKLSRLFENKKNCVLGITKYAKDPDYVQIKAIEEHQKKERLAPTDEEKKLEGAIEHLEENQKKERLAPTDEEKRLEGAIEQLSQLVAAIPALQTTIEQKKQELLELQQRRMQNTDQSSPEIEKKKQKLVELQQKRIQNANQSLPDTEEKRKSRQNVEEREKELLQQIGLEHVLRFNELENPSLLSSCLSFLSTKDIPTLSTPSISHLDLADVTLLEERFSGDLKQEIMNKNDYHLYFSTFEEFEQKVLESSLINVILSKTNPEIGQFLHLAEIDPKLVKEYDKIIVRDCIKKYQDAIIGTLNISAIRKIVDDKEIIAYAESEAEALRNQLNILQKFVMGRKGSLQEDPQKADEIWKGMEKERQVTTKSIEEEFALPTWATVCFCIPLGIPYGIRTLLMWSQQRDGETKAIKTTLNTCCIELGKVYQTLKSLTNLEKTIEKQEKIEQAFDSVPISIESWDLLASSILNRINAVRDAYGDKDWDHYVSVLAKEIDLIDFSLSSSHSSCMSAHAFCLIEPSLNVIIEQNRVFIKREEQSQYKVAFGEYIPKIAFVNKPKKLPALALQKIAIEIDPSIMYKKFREDILSYDKKRSKLTCALSAAALLKARQRKEKKAQKVKLLTK